MTADVDLRSLSHAHLVGEIYGPAQRGFRASAAGSGVASGLGAASAPQPARSASLAVGDETPVEYQKQGAAGRRVDDSCWCSTPVGVTRKSWLVRSANGRRGRRARGDDQLTGGSRLRRRSVADGSCDRVCSRHPEGVMRPIAWHGVFTEGKIVLLVDRAL
jgi:hypothetical protein